MNDNVLEFFITLLCLASSMLSSKMLSLSYFLSTLGPAEHSATSQHRNRTNSEVGPLSGEKWSEPLFLSALLIISPWWFQYWKSELERPVRAWRKSSLIMYHAHPILLSTIVKSDLTPRHREISTKTSPFSPEAGGGVLPHARPSHRGPHILPRVKAEAARRAAIAAFSASHIPLETPNIN